MATALLGIALGLGRSRPAPAYFPARYGGRLSAPLLDRPVTLDPARMTRLGEWQLARLLYDTLFVQDRQGTPPRPYLATGLRRLGAARRSVVITLRPGVRSHRGHPMTAAQVAASLGRLRRGPLGWLLATVRAVRPSGPYRVRLRLARPCPELEQVLAAPPTAILPAPPGERPDGTGPFRLVHGRLGGVLTLAAFAGHFAGRPFLDGLRMRPFSRAQDEVSAFSLRRTILSFRGRRLFGRDPPFATRALHSPAVTTFGILVGARGAARLPPARRALYLAIDKRRLRRLVTGAPTRPAHGPIPPVLRGRRARHLARRPAPHRPEEARRLLARVAKDPVVAAARGPDRRLRLTLLVDRSRPEDLDAARKIMADLWAVGVRLVIRALTPARFVAAVAADRFELALEHVSSPVLRSRYHLAALYAAAHQPARAAQIVADVHARLGPRSRRFMRELPLIPLFHHGVRVHLDPARARLRLGPWGLVDWADVSLPPARDEAGRPSRREGG